MTLDAHRRVIDAHLHVWDTSEVPIGWLEAAGLPPRAAIPTEDPADRRYILVEADAEDPQQEAEWLISRAQAESQVHGVVVSVRLEEAGVAQRLEELIREPAVVGVRRLLQDRGLYEDPGLLSGLRELARQGLPFDACVRANELGQLSVLLEQIPELTVVLDHMGKPPVQGSAQEQEQWRTEMRRLAKFPQVHCKLSGLPAECRDQEQLETHAGEIIGYVYELFGPKRCMVGSDRPVSSSQDDWCQRVLAAVPEEHHDAVGHQNAARIYRRRA